MHVVIWTSKSQRYATPSDEIVEVVTMVRSRPIPGSETWMKGLFDYRGKLLPLFDSSLLLGHEESTIRMSSRILVLRCGESLDESTGNAGLIVEHVLGADEIDFGEASALASAPSGVEFLGPVARAGGDTIQLTSTARLATLKV